MPSTFSRFMLGGLLIAAASCEVSTSPGTGSGGSGGFSLLIERRNAAGSRSFYMMSADGERFTPFTGVPADARTLIPSPDGTTIAYLRDTDGFVELWAMDRDGANRRPVVAGSYFIESAAWSPDGARLAIAFSTDAVSADIAVVNADGSGFVDITPDPLPAIFSDRDPAWSPDGSRIAFSSSRSGNRRLWVMNADGSAPVQVLPSTVGSTERNPVWAPDTTDFIAAVAVTGAGEGITFVRADGSDYKHIVITPGPNDPVWLPDGRLAYIANPTGDYDVWTVDRATGATSQITSRRDHDVHAAVLVDVKPYAWLGLASPVSYRINRPFVQDMAAADVITDGHEDLLLLSPLFNEIRIMKGSATGSLQAVGALFAEADVSALRTALVTLDDAPDVVGRGDSAVYLWRGRSDGPGIATRIALNGELRGMAIADLDGSGRADIATVVENEGQPFRIRVHTAGGTDNVVFAADMATTRTDARSLCAGDMNGDGLADLAIFAGATNLSAFVAQGRGELGVNNPLAAGNSLSSDLDAVPWCADFNNDGRDDVLLFSPGGQQSVAVHRFGTSAFGPAARIAATASSVAIADMDRDGDLDIVLAAANTSQILIAKNRGTGTFDTPTAIALDAPALAVAAADLDGDNWPDVAVVDATGTLLVFFSRGRTGM